jgi:hypothetical protein
MHKDIVLVLLVMKSMVRCCSCLSRGELCFEVDCIFVCC